MFTQCCCFLTPPWVFSSLLLVRFTRIFGSLLSCIARSDLPAIAKDIEETHAVSIRMNGCVDRTQKDYEFVMAKMVKKDGSRTLVFLGHQKLTEHEAEGQFQRVIVMILYALV